STTMGAMGTARTNARPRQHARPGSEDLRRNLKRLLSIAAALPGLLTGSVWATKWDVVPTLGVGEIYTDNVSLASDALKQSDWVTQVTPAISIAATGPRLRFNATYAPEVLYYARGQQDNQ